MLKERAGQRPTDRSNRSVSVVMDRIRLPSIDETKLRPIDTSLSRLAHMQMDYKNYAKARENFEKLASALYQDKENVQNADDFFFKAAMCAVAEDTDNETAKEQVQSYFKMRPQLKDTEQFSFSLKLLDIVESQDQERFQTLIDDNKHAKIWVQKILADLSNQLGFQELEQQIKTRSRKQSVQGLRSDPFYTLYN